MNEYLIGLICGLIVTVGVMYIEDIQHKEEIQVLADEYAANLKALDETETEEYCYAPYGTAVVPERMSTEATVKIYWFHDGGRGGAAFADWVIDDDGALTCELWIHMPKQILSDPDMDSIGHEFLHCVAGDFHPEDY